MSTGENNAPSSEPSAAEPESPDQVTTSPENAGPPVSAPTKLGRGSGPLAARGLGVAKPASPTVSTEQLVAADEAKEAQKKNKGPRPKGAGGKPTAAKEANAKPPAARPKPNKVAVPSTRGELSDDIQAELDAALAEADVDLLLGGPAGMPDRKEPLDDGARIHAQVLKIHQDTVFVGLGGPDEGAIPFVQFKAEPVVGSTVEVIVRGVNSGRRIVPMQSSRGCRRSHRLGRLGRRYCCRSNGHRQQCRRTGVQGRWCQRLHSD